MLQSISDHLQRSLFFGGLLFTAMKLDDMYISILDVPPVVYKTQFAMMVAGIVLFAANILWDCFRVLRATFNRIQNWGTLSMWFTFIFVCWLTSSFLVAEFFAVVIISEFGF